MINEQIRDREVRLIGQDGEQLGIMSAREAQKIALEAELDLVKIAPTAKPPVCKIIDYGKYKYEQTRKEKAEDCRCKGSSIISKYWYEWLEHESKQRKEVYPERKQSEGDASFPWTWDGPRSAK